MAMTNVTEIEAQRDIADKCTHCNCPIYVGEEVKTVTVAKEVFDSLSSMDVLHAQCTHLFCNQCACKFNFESIHIPMANITTEDEDKYLAEIFEGLREEAARELQLDPATLTIDQIFNWQMDKKLENSIRPIIAREQGIHPTVVTDAQIKSWLFE